MNPLKEFFESGQTILWIETQNTIAFLRPVPDILIWTPCPASRLAEFLRLGKISLALTQLLLRALALSDIHHRPNKQSRFLFEGICNHITTFIEPSCISNRCSE